jgi:hypothetical protein
VFTRSLAANVGVAVAVATVGVGAPIVAVALGVVVGCAVPVAAAVALTVPVGLATGSSVGSGAKMPDGGRVAVGVGCGVGVAVGGAVVAVGGGGVAVGVTEVAVGGGTVAVGATGVATVGGTAAANVARGGIGVAPTRSPRLKRPGRTRLPMTRPMANIPMPNNPIRRRQRDGLAGADSGSALTFSPFVLARDAHRSPGTGIAECDGRVAYRATVRFPTARHR